ncbi:ABC transporter permease [Micrococcoides hystricis]|uniref:ABC transporter permease n=1 Tax=Micrococcoides hystricis TaxID=1572761 RepID=A0ABV6PCX6_9MICC
MMSSRKTLLWALAIITPILVLVWWWLGSANSTNSFLPPLSRIMERFQDLWLFAHFQSDVLISLRNLAIGYVIAVILGVALGFVLATVPILRAMFEPGVHFVRGIPPVALVPILITLVGFGPEMRITSIIIAAVFPTMISTIDGIRAVDGGLKDVCTVYQLPRAARLGSVYLPAAGPQIAAGMQVSLQVAFIVMIASEMMGPSQGIGSMTLLAQQSFMSADMWAGILLLGLIGFLANSAFDLIKSRVLAWYIGSKRMERNS